MNYYIQGNKEKADQIKTAFGKYVSTQEMEEYDFSQEEYLFYTGQEERGTFVYAAWSDSVIAEIIKTHPDYKELELPVEPKFKAEDRIVSKSDKSTIYRIITLHDERREYIVEIEHKDFHESCPWIAFEDQDDYELVPKSHYDISNFHAGMPVLVRDDRQEKWCYALYSHNDNEDSYQFVTAGDAQFIQCIPFEGNEHLLGTTDMPDEMYINW